MTDKQQAAVNVLKALGWTFDGTEWHEPRDEAGNPASAIVADMADILQRRLDEVLARAPTDVYAQAVADQIGPLMRSWNRVRPKVGFE